MTTYMSGQAISKNNSHYWTRNSEFFNEWWQRTSCSVAHKPRPTDVIPNKRPLYRPRMARDTTFTRGDLEHYETVRAPDTGKKRPTFLVAASTSSMLWCPTRPLGCSKNHVTSRAAVMSSVDDPQFSKRRHFCVTSQPFKPKNVSETLRPIPLYMYLRFSQECTLSSYRVSKKKIKNCVFKLLFTQKKGKY